MRRTLRRALGIVCALGAVIPLALAVAATPAGATGGDVIALGGSDTTQNFMHSYLHCTDVAASPLLPGECQVPTPAANNGVGRVFNLKVPPNMVGDVTVPSDSHCNQVTYTHDAVGYTSQSTNSGTTAPPTGKEWAPFGSGAGQNALTQVRAGTWPNAGTHPYDNGAGGANITTGNGACLDVARSSSFTSTTGFEYYAFGIDAVGWATPSLLAPASLSLQQLRDIYDCKITDWSQVNGSPGHIWRVLPQDGSGTGDFFIQRILGKGSDKSRTQFQGKTDLSGGPQNGQPCADPILVEENKGSTLLSSTFRDRSQQFIYPYSMGLWNFQANASTNPSVDVRGNMRPGGLVNTDATTGTPGSQPLWPVRWQSSAWTLNNGSIITGTTNPTGVTTLTDVTAPSALSFTITSPGGHFTQAMKGSQVQAPFIGDGTTITDVSGDGITATLDTPTLPCSLLPFNATPTTHTGGTPGTSACTGYTYTGASAVVGWAIISEQNPFILDTSKLQYVGVRYVYNIVDHQSPDYAQALSLVGFDATTTSGVVSDLCSGNAAGAIAANGFLPLATIVRPGVTNTTATACVKRT